MSIYIISYPYSLRCTIQRRQFAHFDLLGWESSVDNWQTYRCQQIYRFSQTTFRWDRKR